MRGVELFAFDSSLHSASPFAPTLDSSMTSGLKPSDDVRWGPVTLREGSSTGALVRTGWGAGPCEWLLVVRRPPPIEPFTERISPWMFALFPTLAVVLALLVGMGPVVASVRRLRGQVKDAARTGYLQPIAGGPRDEIGELGSAFEEARQEIRRQFDELERRERTLREFLENTTHDVNIPLTVLLGYVADLQVKVSQANPVDPALVGAMANEAHYMASLIHNLGAAAKLDSSAPRIQHDRVDLSKLVARAVGRHTPIARQQGIALETAQPEQPIAVQGDVTLIEQAVSNIVYNAVRHNKSGGHVAVILENPTPERFRIKVIDDGPGIPEAELARLVERRFRGDAARSRDPSGQGLGLNITFQIAQLHGFELTFARSEFGGLEVRIEGIVAA